MSQRKPIWERKSSFCGGDVVAVHRITRWFKPSTYTSARIRQTTDSEWNHLGILVWDEQERRWYVVEALFSGVIVRPLEVYFDPKRYRLGFFTIPLPQRDRDKILDFALDAVGSKYSFKRILAIRLFQLCFGYKTVGNIRIVDQVPPDSYICSGLVIRSYRAVSQRLGGLFSAPGYVTKKMLEIERWPAPMEVSE